MNTAVYSPDVCVPEKVLQRSSLSQPYNITAWGCVERESRTDWEVSLSLLPLSLSTLAEVFQPRDWSLWHHTHTQCVYKCTNCTSLQTINSTNHPLVPLPLCQRYMEPTLLLTALPELMLFSLRQKAKGSQVSQLNPLLAPYPLK